MQDNMFPITRPDLNETRDRLRALPRTGPMLQQTLQYLTRAAQGGVPTVEPFVALSELNEIKRDMDKRSSAQATAGAAQSSGPLVQTLPEQVKQTAGIAALQGMRQNQVMQNMMGRASQAPGPVPEGIGQGAPVQAARGGLMGLPSARFRSGGIVTFKNGGDEGAGSGAETEDNNENENENDYEYGGGGSEGVDDVATAPPVSAGAPVDVNARIADLEGQITAARARRPAAVPNNMVGPSSVRAQMIRDNPDLYGILNTPEGKVQLDELNRLQRFQAEDIARRANEIRRPSIGRMLMDAAEASRGVKGGLGQISAMLAGAGKSIDSQRMQALKEEQELRKEGLGLAEARATALSKVDDLRRAQAKGDVTGEYNARMALAKISKDYGVSLNNLLGRQYSALLGYKGRTEAANTAAAARRASDVAAAQRAASRPRNVPVDQQLASAEVELLGLRPGTPQYARQQAKVESLRGVLDRSKLNPERAFLMRQQILANEDKAIIAQMANFEFSPEMQAAKLRGPEEETRVFTKKLNELRSISRTNPEQPFAEPPPRPGAASPRPGAGAAPAAAPAALPAGLNSSNAGTLLEVGKVYETSRGPGRWNGRAFDSVPAR